MTTEKFKTAYLHPKFWSSWLVVGLSWVLARLPSSWQQAMATGLAKRLAASRISRIDTIRRNIELCFNEKTEQQQQAIVVANLTSSLLMIFDLVNMVWRSAEQHTQGVRVIGEQHLTQAISANKPLLLVSGHFTSLVVACMKLATLCPFEAVYRRLDNPIFETQLYQRGLQKYPIGLFHRKDIADMLKSLADCGTVVIVPDQDFGVKRGAFIPFFGIPTATITTIPQYARQTDAQVLLFSCYREKDGACTLKFEPVLDHYPSDDDVADTGRWTNWLQACIREHPDDYWWMHKRFKTRPDGEADVYKRSQ